MAYRDELESRRAHVVRLEAELESLRRQKARLLELPADAGWLGKTFGVRVLERAFVIDGSIGDLKGVADEAFDVDGRLRVEGDAVIWKGEPEPRPRRVEIRATSRPGGKTHVRVHDTGSLRAYFSLGVLVAVAGQFAARGALLHVFALALVAATVLTLVVARKVRKTTRRRACQAISFEEAIRDASAHLGPQVRIATEEEEVVESAGGAARAAGEAR